MEIYQAQPASFMTVAAASRLAELAAVATLVPVTTRTSAQLARVTMPGLVPDFAVAANGGVILAGGVPDQEWARRVQRQVGASAPLVQVWAELTRVCDPAWTSSLRIAEELFCYAVIDRAALPPEFLTETGTWARELGWTISLQGRKLYWVPTGLTKTAAVAEIADRIGAEIVLAAGDSLLDTDLLAGADLGIRPCHGELFDTGWTAPHVISTVGSGALAGEEIATWLLNTAVRHQADRSSKTRSPRN